MASDDVSRIESLLREHFARTDKQLSELKSEIVVMKNDIEKIKRDVGFMHDWDLWGLSSKLCMRFSLGYFRETIPVFHIEMA